MKDDKISGADAAAVESAGSIEPDQLSHVAPQRYVLQQTNRLRSLATVAAMIGVSGPMGSLPPTFQIRKGRMPNKYQPHQSTREKARRARQMQGHDLKFREERAK